MIPLYAFQDLIPSLAVCPQSKRGKGKAQNKFNDTRLSN